VSTFNVEFTPSGEAFDVEEGETVLDAALRQGVQIRYGCRSGKCSTCKFLIEDGEIDYGDVSVYSLPDAERDQGWGLLCRARPLTDLLIRDNRPPDLRARPLLAVYALTPELIEVHLQLAQPLDFYPGQFVELGLEASPSSAWRSYSIATPSSSRTELAFVIKRIPGGAFSSQISGLPIGASIRVRGPYGDSYLRTGDRPVLLCAIGSGIAPILSILRDAAALRDARPFLFFYGARSAADLPHRAELTDLFTNHLAPGSAFVPTLDGIDAVDPWSGERGNVTQAIHRGVPEAHRYDAYLCGAPPMCDAVSSLLRAKGLPEQALYMDRFFTTSKDDAAAGASTQPA
jgi:propane monooxygenase reductase component